LFDELFLFEDAAGAHEFYGHGFRKWESFIGDNDEGCGCPAFNADDDIEFSVETAADELS